MPIVRLFVGNLNYEVTEDDLREIFQEAGRPTTITIMNDGKGDPRGFAFVRLDTMGEPDDCWREPLQGKKLKGRPMNIDFAIPKDKTRG
jgi:RNA recognition motif-containing protein